MVQTSSNVQTPEYAISVPTDLKKRIQDPPISRFLPKAFIDLFRVIAFLELSCALFYLLSGISLLRMYPFRRRLVALTLIADAALKALVVTYQMQVISPMKMIFQETNILIVHFTPDGSLVSQVSSYLTGMRFIQPGDFYYAVFYAVFLIGFLCTLVHPKTKELY